MLRNIFKSFSVMIILLMTGCVLGGGIAFFVLTLGLPNVETLRNYVPSHASEVFSADGEKIGEFTTERRYRVSFDRIPTHVKNAFVAAEDSNFYEHPGVDLVAFGRAVITNISRGGFKQGASTITQQVARSILLNSRKKKISRKVREMILAYRMEKRLEKDAILDLYLSEIYLGHGAYGIGAAAQNYFHKEVEQITLAEAAILAGLPQRPAEWDPFRNPKKSRQRQRYVLDRMVKENYITQEEMDEALLEPIALYPLENLNKKKAPYFVEYVRTYLMRKYGGETILKKGYRVYTTVRYDFQKSAEKALQDNLRETDKRMGWRGPIRHLNGPEEVESFLLEKHDKILRAASPARILPVEVDPENNRLEIDLSPFESKESAYFGATPVKVGEIYEAVVTALEDDPKEGKIIARVGQTPVEIPFKTMDWVKINDKPIDKPSQILVEGDLIELKIAEIDKESLRVLASLEQRPDVQGAVLSYELETGRVMAMVGGTDFKKSEFNRALQAKRQVGSTFKPLVFAAAIDKGFSPSSIVTDSPLVFKFEAKANEEYQGADWKPRNYGERFYGEIPLRHALIRSMNVPTIKVLNEIGVDYMIKYARSLGMTAPFPKDLTIALGSFSSSLEELMRAYSIFPRLGKRQDLIYITKVLDEQGNVLEEAGAMTDEQRIQGLDRIEAAEDPESPHLASMGVDPPPEMAPTTEQVISPQTAYVMTDMLKGVVAPGGTGGRARIKAKVAGKTGTSNDFHDAWFIGYTPQVMTGVWVGFDDSRPMAMHESGGRAAAPVFQQYMNYVISQYAEEDFHIPDQIVWANVNRLTGKLAGARDPERVQVAFKEGTVPNQNGTNVRRVREPGVRATTQSATPEVPAEGEEPIVEPKQEDTSSYIREEYDE